MEVVGFVIIAGLVLAVIFGTGIYHEKKRRKQFVASLKDDYGKKLGREFKDGEFEHVTGFDKKHMADFHVDDITWNDLNMDEIFKQMNATQSSAGEEYLYYMLRNPKTQETDWSGFEEKIDFFMNHEKERVDLQLMLHEMGYTGKYSIYDYLDNLDTLGKRDNLREILVDLLFIPAIILCFFQIGYGLVAIFALFLYNLSTYFKKKDEIDPYITSFAYVFRILHEADRLLSMNLPVVAEEMNALKENKKAFGKFKRFSGVLMNKGNAGSNPAEIIVDYARMFFHLDIIKFNSMLIEVKKHTNEIGNILEVIGKLDTYIAIGAYRTYCKAYTLPVFEKDHYTVTDIYHPLLKNPVANSIDLKKSVLLTGSNASGKSTFLKTIALNAILAQSIHTVLAGEYVADYYRVYTSLSTQDNIFDGDSFYMAEIKSIKRILDAGKKKGKILSFVDEVLRGTNTIERIAASSVILKALSECDGYCLAATHDIELTDILSEYYDNYHFKEEVKDGDISFSYHLWEGKATTRNAITLLDIMGYDEAIINASRQNAEYFESTNQWKKLEK